MSDDTFIQDRIERQIEIDAPAQRVWALISRPGWFINEGTIGDFPVERDGDVDVVHHPKFGSFPIRTEKLDPPRYAAFRWLPREVSGADPAAVGTLVEFWIDDRPAGGITLRVAESGFAALGGEAALVRKQVDENTAGWENELAAARTWVDQQ
jgi:uncharacterized protein YndB with AHSA1/START domain